MNHYTLRCINPFDESYEVYILDNYGKKTRIYKSFATNVTMRLTEKAQNSIYIILYKYIVNGVEMLNNNLPCFTNAKGEKWNYYNVLFSRFINPFIESDKVYIIDKNGNKTRVYKYLNTDVIFISQDSLNNSHIFEYKYIVDDVETINNNLLWLIDENGEQWNYHYFDTTDNNIFIKYMMTLEKNIDAPFYSGLYYDKIDRNCNLAKQYYNQCIELENGDSFDVIIRSLQNEFITINYAKDKLLSLIKRHFAEPGVDIIESLSAIIERIYILKDIFNYDFIIPCIDLIPNNKAKILRKIFDLLIRYNKRKNNDKVYAIIGYLTVTLTGL